MDSREGMTWVHYKLHAEFVVEPRFRRALSWLRGGLELGEDGLLVEFGPWRVSTPLANVAGAEVTGPFSAWKAIGPRLSLADGGLTFGTNTHAGVCVTFHEPVRGIVPAGLIKHPSLTATVAEPELVARALRRIATARNT
ncbi:hypothetical protein SAMN05421504_101779 [Amycolatopsis xylanica]|uniref:Uncharacterized protein n=1 Tax=Amycolatopsis xylanica TaxID=589385 RepID=A0A1H2U4D4_9PSEU|nr:hypothetical protein [Amycolatopsis xylanica]SDW50930.1 hypothetical protein SAMN05421504_101779 [Amycolatopsis xylanica]